MEPFVFVIFGASGDLTHRKLIPAVFCLFREGLLPEKFAVVGFARRDKTDESLRAELRESVSEHARLQPVDDNTWHRFAENLYYHKADLEQEAGFHSLRQRLDEITTQRQMPRNCLFYCATQPGQFPVVVDFLHRAGLSHPDVSSTPWSRIIVEKPFGRDLESALVLNEQVKRAFAEEQIFRIDHYLGKETVQNILVLRFANSIFEPIWNQKYVDHVQIVVSETVGVEGRGKFYEQAGALRDMVQNHMMHLLCLMAMESPISLDPDAVRDEKVKVLKALRPIPPECAPDNVVRAQYTAGASQGKTAPGYREEEGVAPDSTTETYVALKAYVDNWRWAGVPFYLRTGKRMPARVTEIGIHFKAVPNILFNVDPKDRMQPNILALRIQPNEGISLQFQIKTPGSGTRIEPYKMDFGYIDAFGKEPPEAYERLLLDAARGDSTLFTRSDEVEAAWRFLTPLLEGCAGEGARPMATYPAGAWGPKEADDLIESDGRRWQVMRRPVKRTEESFD